MQFLRAQYPTAGVGAVGEGGRGRKQTGGDVHDRPKAYHGLDEKLSHFFLLLFLEGGGGRGSHDSFLVFPPGSCDPRLP